MSPTDLNALPPIPGYAEACRREQDNRNLAATLSTVPLCGLAAAQLTPKHLTLLALCGNSFVQGRVPQPEDVAMFLWFVSPEYCTDRRKRDKFIERGVARLKYRESVAEISEFLDRTFQDAPATGGGEDRPQYIAPVVFLVDVFASQYGWAPETIMETPLAFLFQCLNAIKMRLNPRAIMFNPSDSIKSKHLRERMGLS